MECPNCNHGTIVLECKLNSEGLNLRRRQCVNCLTRYKTIEIVKYTIKQRKSKNAKHNNSQTITN